MKVRSKINHDSMWIKVIDGKSYTRLSVSRSSIRSSLSHHPSMGDDVHNALKQINSKIYQEAIDVSSGNSKLTFGELFSKIEREYSE